MLLPIELAWSVTLALFLFGTIVGSFLNVLVLRMHTRRSLGGRSHCATCGETLSWRELIPVWSYLLLRGRCRFCGARISTQYVLVEVLSGLLFVLSWCVYETPWKLGFDLILVSVLVAIVAYDMRHTIIPDELVLALLVLAPLALVVNATGGLSFSIALGHLVGGVVAALFFFGLWLMSKGRWVGLGDAKLALPFGIVVGWPAALSLLIFSFWIGALVSVLLLFVAYLTQKGKKLLGFRVGSFTMKSEVPFAPFLALSFLLIYFGGVDVFTFSEVAYSLLGAAW